MNEQRTSLTERFDKKVCLVPEHTDCFIWCGALDGRHRYGKIGSGGRGGKYLQAHRVAFERAYGPIPPGLQVLHTCDNPQCVNPAHLYLGTQADNMRDMAAKGRTVNQTGACGARSA